MIDLPVSSNEQLLFRHSVALTGRGEPLLRQPARRDLLHVRRSIHNDVPQYRDGQVPEIMGFGSSPSFAYTCPKFRAATPEWRSLPAHVRSTRSRTFGSANFVSLGRQMKGNGLGNITLRDAPFFE